MKVFTIVDKELIKCKMHWEQLSNVYRKQLSRNYPYVWNTNFMISFGNNEINEMQNFCQIVG